MEFLKRPCDHMKFSKRNGVASFDETCFSIPSHILPLSFRNMMGHVKIEDVSKLHLNDASTPYDSTTGFTVTIALPHESAPMSISIRDDKS